MKTTLGEEGLTKTWQEEFPKTTECCRCGGESRIGFVAHEGMDDDDSPDYPGLQLSFESSEARLFFLPGGPAKE